MTECSLGSTAAGRPEASSSPCRSSLSLGLSVPTNHFPEDLSTPKPNRSPILPLIVLRSSDAPSSATSPSSSSPSGASPCLSTTIPPTPPAERNSSAPFFLSKSSPPTADRAPFFTLQNRFDIGEDYGNGCPFLPSLARDAPCYVITPPELEETGRVLASSMRVQSSLSAAVGDPDVSPGTLGGANSEFTGNGDFLLSSLRHGVAGGSSRHSETTWGDFSFLRRRSTSEERPVVNRKKSARVPFATTGGGGVDNSRNTFSCAAAAAAAKYAPAAPVTGSTGRSTSIASSEGSRMLPNVIGRKFHTEYHIQEYFDTQHNLLIKKDYSNRNKGLWQKVYNLVWKRNAKVDHSVSGSSNRSTTSRSDISESDTVNNNNNSFKTQNAMEADNKNNEDAFEMRNLSTAASSVPDALL